MKAYTMRTVRSQPPSSAPPATVPRKSKVPAKPIPDDSHLDAHKKLAFERIFKRYQEAHVGAGDEGTAAAPNKEPCSALVLQRVPSRRFRAKLVGFNSEAHCILKIEDKEYSEMKESMKGFYSAHPHILKQNQIDFHELQEGLIVCVGSWDSFLRAEIKYVDPLLKFCAVKDIDTGDYHAVDLENVYYLEEQFFHTGSKSLECILDGLQDIGKRAYPQICNQLLLPSNTSVKVKARGGEQSGPFPVVSIITSEGESLIDLISRFLDIWYVEEEEEPHPVVIEKENKENVPAAAPLLLAVSALPPPHRPPPPPVNPPPPLHEELTQAAIIANKVPVQQRPIRKLIIPLGDDSTSDDGEQSSSSSDEPTSTIIIRKNLRAPDSPEQQQRPGAAGKLQKAEEHRYVLRLPSSSSQAGATLIELSLKEEKTDFIFFPLEEYDPTRANPPNQQSHHHHRGKEQEQQQFQDFLPYVRREQKPVQYFSYPVPKLHLYPRKQQQQQQPQQQKQPIPPKEEPVNLEEKLLQEPSRASISSEEFGILSANQYTARLLGVDSYGYMFIHVEDAFVNLEYLILQRHLNEFYRVPKNLIRAKLSSSEIREAQGKKLLAVYSEGNFVRAQIYDATDVQEIECTFVDAEEPDFQRVPFENVFRLEETFLKLPPRGKIVYLDGLESHLYTLEIRKAFKATFSNPALVPEVLVTNVQRNDQFYLADCVKMSLRGQDVAELLKKHGAEFLEPDPNNGGINDKIARQLKVRASLLEKKYLADK